MKNHQRTSDSNILLPHEIAITKSGIKIAVCPEMELLGVILFLSEYKETGLVTDFEFEYKRIADAYFDNFKQHKAIHFINSNMKRGFNTHVPPVATLMINRDFTLDQTALATTPYFQNHDGFIIENVIPEFISVMKSFYIESDFENFFLSQTGFCTSILEQTAELFPDWNIISVMESFYGKKLKTYTIMISPLFSPGGYGPAITREDGLAVYSVQGPFSVNDNGFPAFGNKKTFIGLPLHEFGHSFLGLHFSNNPNIRKALEDSEYLMAPVIEKMEQLSYPFWSITIEETILRAVVFRMLSDHQEIDVEKNFRMYYDEGFIYLYTVSDFLEEYINNRDIYPTFDDFIPVLIRELMRTYPRP